MVYVEGKHGYSARILKDSISSDKSFQPGKRILSYEVTYWRGILAELNTHCMLARNSSSSRAIPHEKMQQQLTGRPIRFGQANPGMQDKGEDYNEPIWTGRGVEPQVKTYYTPEEAWEEARINAMKWSDRFFRSKYHKQVYNRLTEPFQMMKTVITATELDNFFWLRYDSAADPSIYELARVMLEARSQSVPEVLHPGEWHLPYVRSFRTQVGMAYSIQEDDGGYVEGLSLEDAIKVSGARTAAVSFRNIDYGVEKSGEVYEKLVGSEKIHGSAMEHQATPIAERQDGMEDDNVSDINVFWRPHTWEPGITHMDRDKKLWSAKFQGWIMYRKLIKGENHTEEVVL